MAQQSLGPAEQRQLLDAALAELSKLFMLDVCPTASGGNLYTLVSGAMGKGLPPALPDRMQWPFTLDGIRYNGIDRPNFGPRCGPSGVRALCRLVGDHQDHPTRRRIRRTRRRARHRAEDVPACATA